MTSSGIHPLLKRRPAEPFRFGDSFPLRELFSGSLKTLQLAGIEFWNAGRERVAAAAIAANLISRIR
jgi:hypothetical protein